MIEDLDYKFDDLIEDESENDIESNFEEPRFNDLPELGQPVENSVFQPKSPVFQHSPIQEKSAYRENNQFEQNIPFQQNFPVQQNSPFQVEDSVLMEEQAQNFHDDQPFLQKSSEQLNQVLVGGDLEENEYGNNIEHDDNSDKNSEEKIDVNPDDYSDDESDMNQMISAVPEEDESEDENTNEYENIDEINPENKTETIENYENSEQQAVDFIEQHIASEGSNYGDDIELNVPESDGQADSSIQYR